MDRGRDTAQKLCCIGFLAIEALVIDIPSGLEKGILNRRKEIYELARQKNPGRWTRQTRNWEPIEIVLLNPAPKRSSEENLNKAA